MGRSSEGKMKRLFSDQRETNWKECRGKFENAENFSVKKVVFIKKNKYSFGIFLISQFILDCKNKDSVYLYFGGGNLGKSLFENRIKPLYLQYQFRKRIFGES